MWLTDDEKVIDRAGRDEWVVVGVVVVVVVLVDVFVVVVAVMVVVRKELSVVRVMFSWLLMVEQICGLIVVDRLLVVEGFVVVVVEVVKGMLGTNGVFGGWWWWWLVVVELMLEVWLMLVEILLMVEIPEMLVIIAV